MAISSQGHIDSLKDVVDALEEGREPFINGEEAMKAVKIVTAGYESSRLAKPVALS